MSSKETLLRSWREMQIYPKILSVFEKIPREEFVSPQFKDMAYEDKPLPTLRKQSISQPSTIMFMLHALDVQEGDKVLEVGAGVGYQATLLSHLIGTNGFLVSVEVIPELVQIADINVKRFGIGNAYVVEADGSTGYPDHAPYDKIIITAACPEIPQLLLEQLREGGTILAPVGDLEKQLMVKGIKRNDGLDLEFLGQFTFVPMKGRYGFKEVEIFYE